MKTVDQSCWNLSGVREDDAEYKGIIHEVEYELLATFSAFMTLSIYKYI